MSPTGVSSPGRRGRPDRLAAGSEHSYWFSPNHEAPLGASSCRLGDASTTGAIVQDCHAVFQPSYARLIRFRAVWAMSSAALPAAPAPLHGALGLSGGAVAAPKLARALSGPHDPYSDDGSVRVGAVPCDGTRSEVVARRSGGIGALAGSRSLPTGGPRKAARMISISYVRAGG
jgi:hypothetical protein